MACAARTRLCPLLLISLLLAGCTETTEHRSGLNGTTPPSIDRHAPPDVNPDVDLQTAELEDVLAFGVPTRVRSGATFQIEIPVTNRWETGVLFDYRFTFLDEQGAELRPEMDWKTGAIAGGDSASLRAVSRHPKARNYRLDVRWSEEMTALMEGEH